MDDALFTLNECNHAKLERWRDIVRDAPGPVILTDADMLCFRDPSHAFDTDFDVAYTRRDFFKRSGRQFPMNGGVVFVRPNERSRGFFDRWVDVDQAMLDDLHFHREWEHVYGGQNQSSFGYLYSTENPTGLVDLPCSTWNLVDDWPGGLTGNPVFVHIKSKLRMICLAGRKYHGSLKPIVREWKRYAEAGRLHMRNYGV
jgi:hypothetical protein